MCSLQHGKIFEQSVYACEKLPTKVFQWSAPSFPVYYYFGVLFQGFPKRHSRKKDCHCSQPRRSDKRKYRNWHKPKMQKYHDRNYEPFKKKHRYIFKKRRFPKKESVCYICKRKDHWANKCSNKQGKAQIKIAYIFSSSLNPADWDLTDSSDSGKEQFSVYSSESDSDDLHFKNLNIHTDSSSGEECSYLRNCFMFTLQGSITQQIQELKQQKSNLAPGMILVKNRLQSRIDELTKQLPTVQNIQISDDEEGTLPEEWIHHFLVKTSNNSEGDILLEIRRIENELHTKRLEMQYLAN
jgi:hypothetical protein